eukprot:513187-Heterocapsa_arctica.AAC.1
MMWSASNSLLRTSLPFQARIATPPDLPVMPSSFFSVTIAGSQTPCHPFRKAGGLPLLNFIVQSPVLLNQHNVIFAVIQHVFNISLRTRQVDA